MTDSDNITWWSIRTIYLFNTKKDGTNIFEERVCAFSGITDDEVFAKAAIEAEEYSQFHKMPWHHRQEGYLQDGDSLIDGYEVWSQLFEYDGDIDAFVKTRYEVFTYNPE